MGVPEDGVLAALLVAAAAEEEAEGKKAPDTDEGLAKAWLLSLPADMAATGRGRLCSTPVWNFGWFLFFFSS
uniref:Uncharacterized protein n=1 Tax=Oryza brachyantha TaxID=4533 RepID=J3MXX8_ORYBR